jgi:probable HAF family extracellular repeat protein
LDKGVFTQIDFPGAPQTVTQGINNRGQIVGAFGEALEEAHGFLLDDGVYTQFEFPGAASTVPSKINDRGQIVGGVTDSGGAQHGFLATRERFRGKASGVGAEQAAVEIAGSFTSPIDLDLSAATLTITSVLNEQAGGGELVRGEPLVLTAVPGSDRHLARFEDPSRADLVSAVIRGSGSGAFIFTITVDAATIDSPRQCSPTRLTTSFRLDAPSALPTVIATERSWDCSGPSNTVLETH